MTKAGDVIRNPVTGDQITFLLTAHETYGALLHFESVSPVGWLGPPLHVHEGRVSGHAGLVPAASTTSRCRAFTASARPLFVT